jgi:hypothetical protein
VTARTSVLLLGLLAVAGCRQAITVDTKAAQTIPAEIAVEGLQDLLPKAAFLGCGEPTISFMQDEIKSWKVDDKGVEFQPKGKEPYRMAYSSIKGTQLTKVILSFEVRLFVGERDFFRFNWREEQPSRRALEFFEALREAR